MMEEKMNVLWVDFRTGKVNEDRLTFPQISKIMKLETVNDAQILVYENIYV